MRVLWVLLAAALLAALLVVLRDAPERGDPSVEGDRAQHARGASDGGLVRPPAATARAAVTADEEAKARRESEARAAGGGRPRSRAPLEGRLIDAGTGEPLELELRVRLRTGDLALSETVVTTPDGRFTSARDFPRGWVLAQVLRPAGDPASEGEHLHDPAEPDEWELKVPWPDFARGRIVDMAGEPVAGALVTWPRGDGWPGAADRRTGGDGVFFLEQVATGPGRLCVERGFERADAAFVLVRGPNELGDVVVPFRPPGGPVSGTVRSPAGRIVVQMHLRGPDGDVAMDMARPVRERSDLARFEFRDVPQGEYELSAVGLDGARYSPRSVRVAPPATDIAFEVAGSGRWFAPDVRLPELVEEPVVHVLARVRGEWWLDGESFLREDVESWVVVGEGLGPFSATCPPDAERDVAVLEPGFGRAFLFVESGGEVEIHWRVGSVRGRPVEGVAVLADGRPVARSGADGMALVELADAPSTFDFARTGWSVRSVSQRSALTAVGMLRD